MLIQLAVFIIARCDIPPSPNFDISNFTGDWNAVGIFSTTDMGLSFYSCATVNVTDSVLTSITINLTYIETQLDVWITSVQRFVPSPLNKAILVSSKSPKNNLVVTYYDSDAGQAVLINPTSTFGLILSRSDDPNHNNFTALSDQILTNLSMSLSNITYIYNTMCATLDFQDVRNFDAYLLEGNYYANALFAIDPAYKEDTLCLSAQFQGLAPLFNFTTNLTFNNGQSNISSHLYLPKPGSETIFMNTEVKGDLPYAFIYINNDQQAYLALDGDGSFGFLFSKKNSVLQEIFDSALKALIVNGLNATTDTFFLLNSTCTLYMGTDRIIY